MNAQVPSDDLSIDQLAEIGRLSIAKHLAELRYNDGEIDRDKMFDAHNDWIWKMSEFGLLRKWETGNE